ncbi:enoyl-CoA hydratase [Phytoactinopolyspora alkaliphila]|uniref:Enoyl-CoA hydratase n=1 Tax=Phytoactinopolyspora alkaliphila TaxID=1783498 RepID=A0A6N9YT23_9ACTN|nr:enoyl-CoA hydratase [Phytoactinopolyspora alkaliphila]
MTDPVRYDVAGGVATVTLNRPDALNSLNTSTKEALRDRVRDAAADRHVRAVVLAGTGRAFCVGEDLGEHGEKLQRGKADLGDTVRDHYNPTVRALTSMPKPVVAAVNGIAAGAGASYAFACDLRVVGERAGFNLAFAAVGLSCDTGASWTLPRLVGWAKARELLLLPRTVDAAEAKTIGLATEVVPDAAVLPRAQELAARLAAGPTAAYAAIRRALDISAVRSFDESIEHEEQMMQLTGNTRDHREAVKAFLDKRTPVFRGE